MPERFSESLAPTVAAVIGAAALLLGVRILHGFEAQGAGLFESTSSPDAPAIRVERFQVPETVAGPPGWRVETPRIEAEIVAALAGTRLVDVHTNRGAGRLASSAAFRLTGTLGSIDVGFDVRTLPYTQLDENILHGLVSIDFQLVEVATNRVVVAESLGVERENRSSQSGSPETERQARLAFTEELERSAADEIARRVVAAIAPIRLTRVDASAIEIDRGSSSGLTAGQLLEVLPPGGIPARGTGEMRSLRDPREPLAVLRLTEVGRSRSVASLVKRTDALSIGMTCVPLADWRPSETSRPDPLAERF